MFEIIPAIADLIMSFRNEKVKKDSNEYKFFQEVHDLFYEYDKKVEIEKSEDELLMLSGYDLAVEGLELIVNQGSKLLKSDYLESVNKKFKQMLIELINQSKSDLIYYQEDWEDDFEDPSREIIDSIISIYKEAEDKIKSN